MKNVYLNNHNILKKSALLWLILVICLIIFAGWLFSRSKLNTSVLSLLPQANSTTVPNELIDGFQNRLDKQLVWLIKPAQIDNVAPVQWWYNALKEQSFIQEVNGSIDSQFQKDWAQSAYQYRYQLVDPITLHRIESDSQLSWILSQIYSPFSGLTTNELDHDPLLITRSTQLNQLSQKSHLTVKHNWLTAEDEQNNTWYMIYAELKGSSFDMNQSQHIVEQLNTLADSLQRQWPDTEIIKRGVLFYSHAASTQAKQDITTIGSLSILGIIALIILIFCSIRPILLTLLSITIGIVCGAVAVLAIFGEIHIITLVMSTSIIGIAIDYALHYLTERLLYGNQESPWQSLNKLISTLVIALITSLLAYLILLFTPFPGLKQLATFAIFGLIGAFLTVACWYPFLVQRLPTRRNIAEPYFAKWLALWQTRSMQFSMTLLALLFISLGLSQLKIDDDVGQLQALPTDLYHQEQKMIEITKQTNDQKWFIVYGQTAEQALQRLEAFLPFLNQAKENGLMDDYQTINLPSQQQQRSNIASIKQHAPVVIEGLQRLGITPSEQLLTMTDDNLMTPTQWLASPLSQGRKLLWLSLESEQSAILIPLSNIQNITELKKLTNTSQGVQWLDRRQDFNDMFTSYRQHLSQLLAIAITVICLSFIYRNWKYGIRIALKSTLPTLLSVGASLAILGLTHQSLNLFSMLALILVIGIGIDYTLFLSNAKSQTTGALLAVSMAALTTLLSFGLLVLSHTHAIVGFGLVLTGGIFTAFLFAPIGQPPNQIKKISSTAKKYNN